MSDDSKVVHAFPASAMPENLMQITPKGHGVPYFCNHESVRLDEHDRTVTCAKCNATLEPFNFLMSNARTMQMAWHNYRDAQRQVGELNDRITALKKEEARLRAMVKRLSDKTAVVDVRGKSTL